MNYKRFLLFLLLGISINFKSNGKEDLFPKCATEINRGNPAEIIAACSDPNYKGQNLVYDFTSGNVAHPFGTLDKPSDFTKFIAEQADKGEPRYQFLYSLLLVGPLVADLTNHSATEAKKLRIRADSYRRKAADAGFTAAQQYYVSIVLGEFRISGVSTKEKESAIEYAQRLVAKGHSEYATQIFQIQKIVTNEERMAGLEKMIKGYQSVSTEKLLETVKGLEMGHIVDYSRKIPSFTRIEPNPELAIELLTYLVVERKSLKAGAVAGKYYLKTRGDEIMHLLRFAAEGGEPEAQGILGEYLACKGKFEEAMPLLTKSRAGGYGYAIDSLEEIKELGEPTTCGDYRP